ncbi:ubiquitin carboxyl-terminal hydrolase 22-like [Uloborus diversus]|uniref:ubiquitin carboxyl-terminal hydrolase 22-like n=1 Tax=Uloborus diversus TaxID=327109 RepID=UPI00240A4F30|nr:ubiquitin carboxyl-terminal hydrolase 22-like [Uloborus diversus]
MNNPSCVHVDKHKSEKGTHVYKLIHSHLVTCVPEGSLTKKANECYCYECQTLRGRLHACLDCVYFGCYNDRHIHQHAETEKHNLAVDINVGKIHCFVCKDYMYDPELEEISRQDKLLAAQVHGIDYWDPWLPSAEEIKLLKDQGKWRIIDGTKLGLRGLVNLGNTCFMSSIIQVLIHTPIFRDYFLSDRHDCKFQDSSMCLVCEVSNLFQAFYSRDVSPYVPYKFLHVFWKESNFFASHDQQDAHEFFMTLLDIMCKHFRGASQNDILPAHGYSHECECIIHQIFTGLLQSDVICPACHFVSTKTEPFSDISLDLRDSPHPGAAGCSSSSADFMHSSLVDCLERYTHQEHLDCKRICDNCKNEVHLIKQLTMKKLPIIASFHLKRVKPSWKNSTHVSFNECLDMTPFMCFTRGSLKSQYEETPFNLFTKSDKSFALFAVVKHLGNEEGGHYVAYVRQHGNEWYLCDDQIVQRVSLEDVLQSEGYLLFYHKRLIEYEMDST